MGMKCLSTGKGRLCLGAPNRSVLGTQFTSSLCYPRVNYSIDVEHQWFPVRNMMHDSWWLLHIVENAGQEGFSQLGGVTLRLFNIRVAIENGSRVFSVVYGCLWFTYDLNSGFP